jgi:hypothetical protein
MMGTPSCRPWLTKSELVASTFELAERAGTKEFPSCVS